MQTPGFGAPSPPKGPPWGWIVGCCGAGCAAAAILVIIFAINVANLAKNAATDAAKDSKVGVPAPKEYMGAWSGKDGSYLTIHSDGKSDFSGGGLRVTGAPARLEPALKTLHIKFFGIGRDFHVDSPPHKENGATLMTLSGVVWSLWRNWVSIV